MDRTLEIDRQEYNLIIITTKMTLKPLCLLMPNWIHGVYTKHLSSLNRHQKLCNETVPYAYLKTAPGEAETDLVAPYGV